MPRDYISADGYGITDKCRRYLLPLIQGEDYPAYRDGLPVYVTLAEPVGGEEAAGFRDRQDGRGAQADGSFALPAVRRGEPLRDGDRARDRPAAAALLVHAGRNRLRPRPCSTRVPAESARPRLHLRALRYCCGGCGCC